MMHRLRGRAEVARQAHNLEAVGSIPTPATNDFSGLSVTDGLFFASVLRSCVVIITAALQPFLSCFLGRFSPVFGKMYAKMYAKCTQNIPPQPLKVKPRFFS